MKKTTKILGMLFVAAALFMGCKQNADEQAKQNITGELFSEDETTVDAASISLADGNWTIRLVQKETSDDAETTIASELICVVKDGAIDETKDFTFKFNIVKTGDREATAEEKAEAESNGFTVEGTKATLYKEYNTLQIAALSANTNRTGMEDEILLMFSAFMSMARTPSDLTYNYNFKTNSDNSKYFGTEKTPGPNSTEKLYIAKN